VAPLSVLCVLQARTSSTRLPGKVLMPILGEPMLARQVERIRRATRIDQLVIATSDEPSDDPVAELCADLDLDCVRGSLEDVLDRFLRAAERYGPAQVMRLTGDCPLTDPAILDALVALHTAGDFDYSSNVEVRTYPDGLDAEIFTYDLLQRAARDATSPYDREHVTPFMYGPGAGTRRGVLRDDLDRSGLRWTVDLSEDLAFVRRVYEALYPRDPAFSAEDVHRLLAAHPEIAALDRAP